MGAWVRRWRRSICQPKRPLRLWAGLPVEFRTDGRRWRPVEQVVDLWEIETEWWTPQPVNRRYWRLALTDGGLLTVYRDLATGQWFRQGY